MTDTLDSESMMSLIHNTYVQQNHHLPCLLLAAPAAPAVWGQFPVQMFCTISAKRKPKLS